MSNKKLHSEEVFQKEVDFLEHARKVMASTSNDEGAWKEEYKNLCDKYDRLIGEAKILTSISDRLHHKLNQANDQLKTQSEEIGKINHDLKVNNQILQDTIDQLVKARVGRKAGTIVLLIAIVLFIVSEGVLEPFIEQSTNNAYFGFFSKMGIAVLLKPIDTMVEKYLMRQTLRKKDEALL